MAEDQLEQQAGIGLSGDGNAQGIAVGEVELSFPSRRMLLGELHLLWAMQRPPPELGDAEPAGMPLLVSLSLPKGAR